MDRALDKAHVLAFLIFAVVVLVSDKTPEPSVAAIRYFRPQF